MNNIVLIGRNTKDVELRYIPTTNMAVAQFSMAIDRARSKEKKTDFINIKAFGKTAEYLEKCLLKGKMIAVQGEMQEEKWESKEGEKRSKIVVLANNVQILEWGDKKPENQSDNAASNIPTGFELMLDDDDSDIPF